MSDSEDDTGSHHVREEVIKVCILGDGASGKTSIATVLSQNAFNRQYAQTVGLDFFKKRLDLPNGRVALLQIWDVGGQQIGGTLLPTYIAGAHAILFVYDVTNEESFKNVEDWMAVAKSTLSSSTANFSTKKEQTTNSNENDPASTVAPGDSPSQQAPVKSSHFKTHFALVGNKSDLQHMVVVKPQQHENFAALNAMSSHLVSASRADGVELMIKKVAAAVLGVKLDKSDIESAQKVVPASVLQSPPVTTTPGLSRVETQQLRPPGLSAGGGGAVGDTTPSTPSSAACNLQ